MPPQDGIQDIDFTATPPSGYALQIISPIAASVVLPDYPAWLKGVRVHARFNSVEWTMGDAKTLTLAELQNI